LFGIKFLGIFVVNNIFGVVVDVIIGRLVVFVNLFNLFMKKVKIFTY